MFNDSTGDRLRTTTEFLVRIICEVLHDHECSVSIGGKAAYSLQMIL